LVNVPNFFKIEPNAIIEQQGSDDLQPATWSLRLE